MTNSNETWVAGSVSEQINNNFHAWSTDCKTFIGPKAEQEANEYADECWNQIIDTPGMTTFCYELVDDDLVQDNDDEDPKDIQPGIRRKSLERWLKKERDKKSPQR